MSKAPGSLARPNTVPAHPTSLTRMSTHLPVLRQLLAHLPCGRRGRSNNGQPSGWRGVRSARPPLWPRSALHATLHHRRSLGYMPGAPWGPSAAPTNPPPVLELDTHRTDPPPPPGPRPPARGRPCCAGPARGSGCPALRLDAAASQPAPGRGRCQRKGVSGVPTCPATELLPANRAPACQSAGSQAQAETGNTCSRRAHVCGLQSRALGRADDDGCVVSALLGDQRR